MEIIVNDQPHDVPGGTTIARLLVLMKLEPTRVAVEVNFDLVPRDRHATHVLTEGDRLEVVTLVGGG